MVVKIQFWNHAMNTDNYAEHIIILKFTSVRGRGFRFPQVSVLRAASFLLVLLLSLETE